MSNMQNALGVIASCAGVGGFLDFLLGKNGQKFVRVKLEKLWITLDDIKSRPFSVQEVIAATTTAKLLFGTWRSFNRVKAIAAVLVMLTGLYAAIWVGRLLFGAQVPDTLLSPDPSTVVALIVGVLLFSISISISIWLLERSLKLFGNNHYLNASLFIVALMAQIFSAQFAHLIFLIFAIGPIVLIGGMDSVAMYVGKIDAQLVFKVVVDGVPGAGDTAVEHLSNVFSLSGGDSGVDGFLLIALTYLPAAMRIAFAAVFSIWFFVRPVRAFFLLILLRLSEIDKPIFAMLFGSLAAVAKWLQSA